MATKPKRQKSIIFRVVILIFAIYSIASMVSLQMKLTDAKNELASIETQKDELKQKNQEMITLLEKGSEKDFIERAARDRLGYVYADEEVFTDISGS